MKTGGGGLGHWAGKLGEEVGGGRGGGCKKTKTKPAHITPVNIIIISTNKCVELNMLRICRLGFLIFLGGMMRAQMKSIELEERGNL